MSDAPFVNFFTSDFLAGTSGMTAATKGVYITLLCLIYETEKPLAQSRDALARRCGCTVPAFEKALAALIEDDKMEIGPDGIWSKKCEKHIASRRERRNSAKAAAEKRWEKSEGKQGKGDARAYNPQCKPEPEPEPLREDPPNPPSGGSFAAFWEQWPNKTSRQSAERAWKAVPEDDRAQVIASAAAWFGWWRKSHPEASPIAASKFLRGRRWQDEGFAAIPPEPVDIRRALADRIKSGKSYLVRDITPATARDLIEAGFVTPEECRRAGVA